MSSVDQRVVEMKFNSSAFSKGIADTLAALTKLQNALKLDGAGKGAKAASDSIDALGLKAGGLGGKVTGAAAEAGRGLDQLGQKAGFVGSQFTAMQAVAFGALASIGAKALQVGEMVGSALTVAPLMSGLKEYELNLNSIQTILANTKVAGVGLTEVNAALDELNDYSDRTIYNFGQMANAIGLFTASGVDLDRSVGSIKGIANLAAMSGSSAEQAAGLYRQLSQAISAGRVSLQDWNSVMTAGMGGTVFQRALAQTGVAMGTISEGALKLEGPMQNVMISGKSFRDSIDATQGPSWLTSDVLVATLEQFTGDLTDAELAAQGFSGAQIAAIQDTARTASLAAQEVKTLSQAFDIAQETAGSGWSQTWRLIFGDFEEAKTTFTEFSNWMNGFIKTAAEGRNAVLQGWKNLGGRDVMLEGFRNAGTALLGVLRPIGEAFRTIFPKTTPGELFRFTQAFANFTKSLIPTQETADNLRRTFAGLFAVLGIVWDFVKAGASFLLRLFGVITEGSGSILAFTGNIGDFLVKLHEAITEGELFSRFFDGLAGFIEKPIIAIKALIGWFTSLFSSASSAGATESVDQLTDAMGQLGNMVERIGRAWAAFSDWVSELWEKAQPGVDAIKEAFEDLIDSLVSALSNITLGDILAGIATGSFVAAVAAIKKFFDELDIGKFFGGGEEGEGFLAGILKSLEELTETLQAMQNALNAHALLAIAVAIGILTLSIKELSKIDVDDLTKAMTAITVMIGQLYVVMKLFSKIDTRDAGKLIAVGVALVAVSIAIRILASAAKSMAELDWNEIAKGLTGLLGLMILIVGVTKGMPGSNAKMIQTATGLVILAAAVKILVSAVKDLTALNWEELSRGISGVAVLLTALALFTKFADANNVGIRQGVGIVLLAAAIKILADALGDFEQYNWEELARGMSGIAVGLGLIAGAIRLIPANSVLKAASVVIVAAALKVLASALKDMSDLDWNEMAKGLTGVTGGLTAMTIALKNIPARSVISATALVLTAYALKDVAETLDTFADFDWEEIAKSLVTLAGALLIIGAAMKFMQTSILGAAALVIVGISLGMFGDALTQLGGMSWGEIAKSLVVLAGALLIIGVAVTFMAATIPGALALIVIAAALRVLTPAIVELGAMSWSDIFAAAGALTLLFIVLAIGGVLSPLIVLLAVALTVLGVAVMAFGAGIRDIGTGVSAFADGIEKLAAIDSEGLNNLSEAMDLLAEKIPVFLASIGEGLVALAATIAAGAPAFGDAAAALIQEMARVIRDEMPDAIAAVLEGILGMLSAISSQMPAIVDKGSEIIVKLLQGLARNTPKIAKSGADAVIAFLNAIGAQSPRITDAAFKMIIDLINGLADTIREKGPQLRKAGANLVDAIFDGMTSSVNKNKGTLMSQFTNLAGGALNAAKAALGIKSPSREFAKVGMWTVQGFANGVDDYAHIVYGSTEDMGKGVLETMGKTISGLGSLIGDNMDDLNPVITPVLDLSAVQKESGQIGSLLQTAPIDLSEATAQASTAAAGYLANLEAVAEQAASSGVTQNFTQINNSPKALSSADIYRQTNNQISQAKGALANAN